MPGREELPATPQRSPKKAQEELASAIQRASDRQTAAARGGRGRGSR